MMKMVTANSFMVEECACDTYGVHGVATVTQIVNPNFQYAGYYAYQGSGLNLTWYRSYDPVIGRWQARDPIGEDGGINLYGYVGNDPINLFDINGLCSCDADWSMVGASNANDAYGKAVAGGFRSFLDTISRNALNDSLRWMNLPISRSAFGAVNMIRGTIQLAGGGGVLAAGSTATATIPVIGQVAGAPATIWGGYQVYNGANNLTSGYGDFLNGISGNGRNIIPNNEIPVAPMQPFCK
jgi:RHS repeat-associated protein